MTCFPFFVPIDGRTFLVVGSGKIARSKIEKLKDFGVDILCVSPTADIDGVRILKKEFAPSDLDNVDFVIAATDEKSVNAEIARLCKERNIPVNAVDDPENCTFIFGSMVKKGKLVVAVSTNGASPAYSAKLRREIESIIPDGIEEKLELMQNLRIELKNSGVEQSQREMILKQKLAELLADEN